MKTLYLTDKQYLDLLKRARNHLDTIDRVRSDDSNDIGNKYTGTNVGLCNDKGLCTQETAMFPEDWPHRKVIKYREHHHQCPLDWREDPDIQGCFYTCMVFRRGLSNIKTIKLLYENMILKKTEEFKDEHE